MSSWRPSFSVVPSPLISRTKAIPNGFSDLSRAEGKYMRGGRGESNMAAAARINTCILQTTAHSLGRICVGTSPSGGRGTRPRWESSPWGGERRCEAKRGGGARMGLHVEAGAIASRICMSGTLYVPQKINPACGAAANPGTCLLEGSSP